MSPEPWTCGPLSLLCWGALYGIGVAEGRIDLNRSLADLGIYDNEPSLTAAEREATVRDLLMMRSEIYHGLGGDGFAALGYRGQAVLVIPSKRLVVPKQRTE